MPLYEFVQKNNKKIYSTFFFPVGEAPEIGGVYTDENGIKWKRVVLTTPQASISSNIDPFNQNQFIEKTGNSKGTIGDLFDRSKEMSEKRAAKAGGVDPVKKKYYDDYAKKRGGRRHFDEIKGRKIKGKGYEITHG